MSAPLTRHFSRIAGPPRALRDAAHVSLPAVAGLWLAFHAGGYFPGTTALVAVVAALALVGRLTLAERPFAGFGPALAVACGAIALLAVWMVLSTTWSNAPARSLFYFDRALLYGGVLLLTGSFAAREGDLRATLRWSAAAFAVVCVAGLLTRLLPGTFHASSGLLRERLSFPLTYWNAMGIAASLGVVLLVHLSASGGEPRGVRVLAAGALPAAATCLYFTFSRGAIWALPVGLLAYLLLAQPRGMPSALLAAVPAAAAVWAAYDADLLATARYDASAAAAAEGRHVLWVLVACSLAALGLRAAGLRLDARLQAIRLRAGERRRLRIALVAGVLLLLGAGAAAADAPRRFEDARRTFAEGRFYYGTGDLRDRLTSAVDNGRVENWRVAWHAFERHPALGTGADTYRLSWERDRRPPPVKVNDGHSLYLETLSELGVPGLLLVLVAVGTPLVGALRGLGGPERHARAALVAAGGMLLLHAGVDWDWEMPALFLWFFGAGGVALALPAGAERLGALGRLPRVVAGLGVLLLALTPAAVAASQAPLDRSVRAFVRGDCTTAIDAALDAADRLSVRPEPYEVLGWCDARAGQPRLAVAAMAAAHRRDPGNWQYAYGLAVTRALAGEDPRGAAGLALRLDPLEPLARDYVRAVGATGDPARWRRAAQRAGIPME